MNPFIEKFKNYESFKLLQILEEHDKYADEAISAAKEELASRSLSDEEINEFKENFNSKKQAVSQRKEFVETKKSKANKSLKDFITLIHPLQNNSYSGSQKVTVTTIFLTLGILYALFNLFYYKYPFVGIFEIILLIIIYPLAIFLFWKRLKLGWVLITINFVFTLCLSFGLVILTIKDGTLVSYILGEEQHDLFPIFMTSLNPLEHIKDLFVSSLFVWVLGNKDVRNEFKISKKFLIILFACVAVIALVFLN